MSAPYGRSGVLVASINASRPGDRRRNSAILYTMPKGLVFILVMIVVIVVYTIAKVISYNRLSKQQWEQVDKSKLKEWDDEDDWD